MPQRVSGYREIRPLQSPAKTLAARTKKATECLMTPKSSCFVTSLRSPRIEITILRRPEASAARAHGTGGVVDSATLARAVEVATIKRKGVVNRKSATWTIPADVSKNKKPHVVHLSAFALAVWDRMCEIPGDGEYVFEGRDGGHVSETEVTRRLTDRQTRNKPIKGRKNSTVLDLPGGHWTQHDLRRTGPRSWENSTYHPTLLTSA